MVASFFLFSQMYNNTSWLTSSLQRADLRIFVALNRRMGKYLSYNSRKAKVSLLAIRLKRAFSVVSFMAMRELVLVSSDMASGDDAGNVRGVKLKTFINPVRRLFSLIDVYKMAPMKKVGNDSNLFISFLWKPTSKYFDPVD